MGSPESRFTAFVIILPDRKAMLFTSLHSRFCVARVARVALI